MLTNIASALSQYTVVLEPDRNEPEWWAGAPSVVKTDEGPFYLAARMREADSPRGKRGYEIRILRSADGRRFETINQLRREDAGVPGFERPALVRDPGTRKFKLYGCAGLEHGWAILKFDDAKDPAEFDARTARPVLQVPPEQEAFARVTGYKDPFVFWNGGAWHMFVIGADYVERPYHFISGDGEHWRPAAAGPILESTGWHNFFTRPACIIPMIVGYLFIYEGSDIRWRDPVYNIATGLAYSPDLETFIDLTPHEPLLKSTTPGDYHTWRYSHWLSVGDQVHVYFEAARPNNSNEVRLAVFPASFARSKRVG